MIISFNTGWYWLVFIALTPIFLFFSIEEKLWRMIFGAMIFRITFGLGSAYFIADPLLFLSSAGIFSGIPICYFLIKKYFTPESSMIFLPFLWTIGDYFTAIHTALPTTILMAGIPLADSPFLGLAGYGGIIGLTLFTAVINLLFLLLISKKINRKNQAIVLVIIFLTLVSAGSASRFLIANRQKSYPSGEKSLKIALMSAGKTGQQPGDHMELSDRVKDADLLVIPENLYKSDLDNSEKIIDFYRYSAEKLDTNLSITAIRIDGDEKYKSSFLISPDGSIRDIYDKNHLTITSEYWPLGRWAPFYFTAFLSDEAAREFKRGKAIFDTEYRLTSGKPDVLRGENYSFASPICGEIHYPGYLKDLNDFGVDFILHNSNNDWITLGLDQYLQLTNNLRRIEAVRLKKPILVTGIKENAGIFRPDGSFEIKNPAEDTEISYITLPL